MSEVPLYAPPHSPTLSVLGMAPKASHVPYSLQGYLTINSTRLEFYGTMPRALWWSWGGGGVLMSKVPL